MPHSSIRHHSLAYVSIRRHTHSIREHTVFLGHVGAACMAESADCSSLLLVSSHLVIVSSRLLLVSSHLAIVSSRLLLLVSSHLVIVSSRLLLLVSSRLVIDCSRLLLVSSHLAIRQHAPAYVRLGEDR
jgi:hypothetical protein